MFGFPCRLLLTALAAFSGVPTSAVYNEIDSAAAEWHTISGPKPLRRFKVVICKRA